jgi:hypothetical protein
LLFTPDLSRGILESRFTPLVSAQRIGYINLYMADTEHGSYEALTPETEEWAPFEEGLPNTGPQAEGASTDLSHVVFQQEASLCCGASGGRRGHVYEWADSRLSLVDVAPAGKTFKYIDDVGASAYQGNPIGSGNPWHAVSTDGSRVFFTGGTEEGGKGGGLDGQLYVRENPTSPTEDCSVPGDACTIEVSASQRAVPDPNTSDSPFAYYRDASADGSRVFFTSKVELTENANTGPEDNAANLYEYDLVNRTLTDLTVDGSDTNGAAVLGLVTASEDGSYVYFVAEGKLTTEGNAVSGKPNLYLYHAGKVTFIATLAPSNGGHFHIERKNNGDEEDWVGEENPQLNFGPGSHTARVTPDGTQLTFESELSLTGYDNRPIETGECENEKCREVYLYSAATGGLVCVSCDPAGARPVGPASLGGHEHEEPGSESESAPYYLPHNLSEGGRRLFFQSPDALVPHDSNGRLDVYEWEQPASLVEAAAGENACSPSSPAFSAGTEGCVFPISNVAGGYESHYMDASPSGDDVFIATGDQLVPSDTDVREDVYDVRVAGGFPVSVAPTVCVNTDSCKPPVSPQPSIFGAAGSATFSGFGNPVPSSPLTTAQLGKKTVKCKKGLVKNRKGKCVKHKKRASKATRTRVSDHRRAGS